MWTDANDSGFKIAGSNLSESVEESAIIGVSNLTDCNTAADGSLLDSGRDNSKISSEAIGPI